MLLNPSELKMWIFDLKNQFFWRLLHSLRLLIPEIDSVTGYKFTKEKRDIHLLLIISECVTEMAVQRGQNFGNCDSSFLLMSSTSSILHGNQISQSPPHFLKIDHHFVVDIDWSLLVEVQTDSELFVESSFRDEILHQIGTIETVNTVCPDDTSLISHRYHSNFICDFASVSNAIKIKALILLY